MTTTPAGNEPHRPTGGPLAPTAPGTAHLQPMNRTQKTLTAVVVGAVLTIATLGFIGSYSAVTHLATVKGFGEFAHAFPIAVDAGIIAFLALDLLLTWRRIAFPLLRYTAWGLTLATIAFNAVAAWPDPVGVSMHGVIPVLFVIAVEAARHAVGRIAEIVADKHIEGPNPSRWLLNPGGTFILWRRQRLWGIRLWDTVLELERERRIYKGQLLKEYGRGWRRKASADKLLILRLATRDGLSITEALELPEKEAEKQRAAQQRIANEQHAAAEQRRREEEEHHREQQRLDNEAAAKAEADRIANEHEALALQQAQEAAARQKLIDDAETQAKLAAIAREQYAADSEAEQLRQQDQLAHARRVADEQERAAKAARQTRENEEAAARAAQAKEAASLRAAEIIQRSASAGPAPASRVTSVASASRTATSQPANAATTTAANGASEPASTTSRPAASEAATSYQPADASTGQPTATSASHGANTAASAVDIQKVVDVYQLLEQQEGKPPSDARLGAALSISRSRAQQLRTAAVDAGHTELAKPMRIAS